MLEQTIAAVETGIHSIMSMLKFHINDYCDLETTWGNSLVAKDGSMATILKYNGFRSLIGKGEFQDFTRSLSDGMEQFLGHRGHQIQIVFHRDEDPSEEVNRLLQPSYETAERIGLQITDLLDEKKEVAAQYCMSEHIYIVVWTRPAVLDPVEVKLSADDRREVARKYKVQAMPNAQNPLRPIRFMIDKHESFVNKTIDLITTLKGAVEEVPVHEAFNGMKRHLYKNTPITWRPTLLGDEMIARWKNNRRRGDMSELSYPRLDDQLFTAPAVVGSRNSRGGVTDTRAVRLGSRIFAPVAIKTMPKNPQSFMSLFQAMNNASSENDEKVVSTIPWSISFLIEGDGLKGIAMRRLFAGLFGWTSADNRNLVQAAKSLQRYKENENGVVVKMQIMAMTWADHGQDKQLLVRRSKLSSSLQGWGNCNVEEETGDPLLAVMSCVPAVALKSSAPESAPPLSDAMTMLPFSRPGSPYPRGTTIFRTLDGKVLPWEVFSDQQSTWITNIFGGPGSGKSVLANRLNEEMCLLGGLTRLPYICVIDIGISSSGFISLIQDSLPEKQKNQALYVRLQNTETYSINMGDTQLGCRYLLPREREVLKNFYVRLATPPERGTAHTYMNEYVGRVIDEVYKRFSDKNERGQPKEFVLGVNKVVGDIVKSSGIDYTEATKWWTIVDALFERGFIYEASVAQRYAVPKMFDVLSMGSDSSLMREFADAKFEGVPVAEEFKLMLTSAMGDFPMFNGVTQFDIGPSRIMALDLQDVVTTGSAPARKQASLMYMAAINAFMRKISIIAEDLERVEPAYFKYHRRRVDELAEDYKRLFCDEYHKTGGDLNLQESFMVYGRESRKWQLEIVLASQLPEDFREIAKIATTILIMDQGNEQTRQTIKEIFGLNATEVSALKRFVNGAKPGVGATFLAKIKTKEAEISQLFTATSGGLELWGLSTTAEDRALRSALQRVMSSSDARQTLKARFPSGSCKNYILRKKAEIKQDSGSNFVDDEAADSLVEALANDIIGKWRTVREME